jgi:hypothetical protein
MNKAFVREPDASDPLCPACGSIGERVEWETVTSLVRSEVLASGPITREEAYFCPLGTCAVVYFDELGRSVTKDALTTPAYPKDPDAPICPCFGLCVEDIERDLAEGAPTRTRAAVQRAKTDEADCLHRNLHGRSCVAEVQRSYVRRQAEKG